MDENPQLPRIKGMGETLDKAFGAWVDALEWVCKIKGRGRVKVLREAAGPVVVLNSPTRMKAKITSRVGSSAQYNVTEVYANTSGTWTTRPSGRVVTAWEANGNNAINLGSTWYVDCEYHPHVAEWRFQLASCS